MEACSILIALGSEVIKAVKGECIVLDGRQMKKSITIMIIGRLL